MLYVTLRLYNTHILNCTIISTICGYYVTHL